eukprot:1158672-Pelagomonas_calceolata.AAC.15
MICKGGQRGEDREIVGNELGSDAGEGAQVRGGHRVGKRTGRGKRGKERELGGRNKVGTKMAGNG